MLLPDGRTVWEREEKHHGGSETQLSYHYSEDVSDLPKDYWGRVVGLKILRDGQLFLPAVPMIPSHDVVEQARRTMERGWDIYAKPDASGSLFLSPNAYKQVMGEVLTVLRSESVEAKKGGV